MTGPARDLAQQNVRYAEITVTPYTFVTGGMPTAAVTEALDAGAQLAKQHHGIKIGYIFDIASQDGADAARATLDHALEHPPQHLVGLGLGAERIGHGIACLEDTGLVSYLREVQLPLEVCPTSNVCTGWPPRPSASAAISSPRWRSTA